MTKFNGMIVVGNGFDGKAKIDLFRRPKNLPGYVSDEMYKKYKELYDLALEADGKQKNKK